jgi:cell division protein FtsL
VLSADIRSLLIRLENVHTPLLVTLSASLYACIAALSVNSLFIIVIQVLLGVVINQHKRRKLMSNIKGAERMSLNGGKKRKACKA